VKSRLPIGVMALAATVGTLLAAQVVSVRAQPVATITLPAPGAAKQLYPGCNNVSLSFPDGTPSDTVIQAVTPAGAVETMWRHSAALNKFEGYSAQFPQASDLLTVNFMDAVWLCMTSGAPPIGQQPSPTPTATATPPAPPPGGGSWGATAVDLAITDIFINPDTTVWARITNNGPSSFQNVSLSFGCTMERHVIATGVQDAFQQNGPGPITVNLDPGQTQEFDTGFQSFDTTQWWYKVTCDLVITYNDTNPANNTYSEYFPPPP